MRSRPSIYERLWTPVAAVTAAAGLFAALRDFGPFGVLGLYLCCVVLGVMLVLPWMEKVTWPSTPLIVAGPVAAAVLVAATGLALVAGPVAMPLALTLVLTSPSVVGLIRRRRPRWWAVAKTTTPVPVEPVPAAVPEVSFAAPEQLNDAELCQAWRSTFTALERAGSVESRMRVVSMRAAYLDELERRHGDAFRAWIESGARAAGDPSRYVDPPS